MEELDALPPYFQITERSIFRVGEVTAVLEAGGLERSDLATLQLMRDNLGKRPIYFSRTTAAYPDRLGLTSFLLGQGLAPQAPPPPHRGERHHGDGAGIGVGGCPADLAAAVRRVSLRVRGEGPASGMDRHPLGGHYGAVWHDLFVLQPSPGAKRTRSDRGRRLPLSRSSPRALGTSARESSTTPVTPETPRASRQAPERTEESGATPDFEPEVHISPGSRLEVASKPGIHPYRPPHTFSSKRLCTPANGLKCPTGEMPVPTEPNARGHPPVISRAVRIIQVGR